MILAFTGGAVWPDGAGAGFTVVAAAFGVFAYAALTAAMRTGRSPWSRRSATPGWSSR